MSSDPTAPALVVGCGYLGGRVAARWRAAGRDVSAVTRSHAAALAAAGLTPVVADVCDARSLEAVRRLPPLGTVVYAVGLDRRDGRPMHDVYVTGLANVLAALPPAGRVVYISSTGVYGQTGGGWVTEAADTEPLDDSGRVVLAAEAVLQAYRPDAVILRLAGLYGPGRLLRGAAVRAGEAYVGDADKWLNLAHVADAAAAVLAAEGRADAPGRVFNIADGSPVTRRQFYTTLAQLLGAPPAQFGPAPGTPTAEANRRIDATLARSVLGWRPAFPSYREGLADAVAADPVG